MKDLQGLTLSDFEKKALVILGYAEVDKDGCGSFVPLENIIDYSIQSNITNIFQKICSWSFNITVENTGDKYSFFDTGKSNYDYIRQGRKIKLYLGIKSSDNQEYYWSWIYGIIDKASTHYDAQQEICNISGRDCIAYLSENFLRHLWWGTNYSMNIIGEKEKYNMPSSCTGIYKAWMYRGEYIEITLNNEYTYDWEFNQFIFLHPSVPPNSQGEIKLYMFEKQKVENVVADILIEAGLLSHTQKQSWLTNPAKCIPTGQMIERVWFNSGTSYLRAIEMLAERVKYRFYVNSDGEPCFKTFPVSLQKTSKRINDKEYLVKKTEERIDELYNHFLVTGEIREMKRINLSITIEGVSEIGIDKFVVRGGVWADGLTSYSEWLRTSRPSTKITSKGFTWVELDGELLPTGAENIWTSYNNNMGVYSHEISGLEPDTDYQVCAWVKNSYGHYLQSSWQTVRTLKEEVE